MTNILKKPANALRILFWNVKDWGAGQPAQEAARLRRVVDEVQKLDSDIACFAEVMDPDIKRHVAEILPPGYGIHETSSENPRRILTIFKNAAARTVTISQRDEFKGPSQKRRPSPLIEVTTGQGKSLAILPVHTPSGSTVEGYNARREESLFHIASLAAEFNRRAVPFIALGDMNTMGNGFDQNGSDEISRIKSLFGDPSGALLRHHGPAAQMALLNKTAAQTWMGIDADAIFPDADLDQVLASRTAEKMLLPFNGRGDKVHVGGWPERPSAAGREQWVRNFSDHAYLMLDFQL